MNVAIIGASSDRSKFGNKAVRAYAAAGHKVFPVSLKEKEIEGMRVLRGYPGYSGQDRPGVRLYSAIRDL